GGRGRRTGGDGRLDDVHEPAVADVLVLQVGEAPFRLQPAATGDRLLRQRRAQLVHQLPRRLHGQQVGLGEVAVVVGIRLRATGRGGAGVLVPVTGLLGDRAAVGEDLRLALDLI